MNYQEWFNSDLWAQVDEVSIDNINNLEKAMIALGIKLDDGDLEEIYQLIKEKVLKAVDN
jgi:hypothetical protein